MSDWLWLIVVGVFVLLVFGWILFSPGRRPRRNKGSDDEASGPLGLGFGYGSGGSGKQRGDNDHNTDGPDSDSGGDGGGDGGGGGD